MITSGYQDTRENGEDFAITPYLFSVLPKGDNKYKTYGFGVCLGWFAIFIAYSFNVPKGYKFFQWFGNITKKTTKSNIKIYDDSKFTPPFRVGRKQKKAVLDAKGLQVVFFIHSEEQAELYCQYLNNSIKN